MKILKKWWFWVLIILFIIINLWANRNQQDPTHQQPLPSQRVGTH